MLVFSKSMDQNSHSAEMQAWCKSLPHQEQDQQGNLIVCFSDKQRRPWNTHHEPIPERMITWELHKCSTNLETNEHYIVKWRWKRKKATNLRDVRVPVNVAYVVIGQASKEIDQMLEGCKTTCYTRKTEILTFPHFDIFKQIRLLTTSQLGRFCTDIHKVINSSNHNLSHKQMVTMAEENPTKWIHVIFNRMLPREISIKAGLRVGKTGAGKLSSFMSAFLLIYTPHWLI